MPVVTPEPQQSADLYYGADTTTFTQLFNIESIGVPDQAYGKIEWTHLASTIKQFIPTIVKEAGELTFRYQHSAAVYNTIEGLKGGAAAAAYWKIGFHDTTGAIIFPGFLMTNKQSDWDNPDDIARVDCMVQVTGSVTITVGS